MFIIAYLEKEIEEINAMKRTAFKLATIAFTAFLALFGCTSHEPGIEAGQYLGSEHKDGKAYSYGVSWLSLKKRPFLAIFNQGSSGVMRPIANGYQGALILYDNWSGSTKDQRSTEWSCTTKDGINGEVVIAGNRFDLAKGNVFLVSAKAKPAEVEQITVDLSKLPTRVVADKQLEAIKFVDPRVVAFLKPSPTE